MKINKGLNLSNAPPTFDVFIIHAARDASLIEQIQEEFRNFPKVQVLIAERRRRPGYILTEKIRELIERSHSVIVVWSPNLEKSITANQEIGYALALNKAIFPFVFSGMTPKGLIEGTEYIECDPADARESIRALIEDVRASASELGYNFNSREYYIGNMSKPIKKYTDKELEKAIKVHETEIRKDKETKCSDIESKKELAKGTKMKQEHLQKLYAERDERRKKSE